MNPILRQIYRLLVGNWNDLVEKLLYCGIVFEAELLTNFCENTKDLTILIITNLVNTA